MKPLAIDLFCGLGGWAEGLLAEGWRVIGYDIEEHRYGELHYPGELVLRDVLTIHGSEFKDADLIVASPPCQEFSYMAMPWSRGKQIANAIRGKGEFPEGYKGSRTVKELTALFDACFRIQKEASEAASHYIPMIVENVRGAQPWVGRARWNFGSFYLWGDVPALMPITMRIPKMGPSPGNRFDERPPNVAAHRERTGNKLPGNNSGTRWEDREVPRLCDAYKSHGMNWSDQTKRGQDFTRVAGQQSGFKGVPHKPNGHWTNPNENGTKQAGISDKRQNGKGDLWFQDGAAKHGSKPPARKAASAMIAKIPFSLSQWIARTMNPRTNSLTPNR